jgi:hypothetical protein
VLALPGRRAHVSLDIHVDIHQVAPSDQFPCWRLVTSEMAERAMTFPEGFDGPTLAELTIALPPEWELPKAGEAVGGTFQEERWYWPIRLLKTLAHIPHDYGTFLWYGHTIPNGDPPAPYADDVGFSSAMIVTPVVVLDGFDTLETPSGRTIRLLGVLPLYDAEMQLKLESGVSALFDRLGEFAVTDVVDTARPNVAY